jgi:hypothetical protein
MKEEKLLAQFLYPLFTLVYLGLLIWAVFLWFRGSSLSLAILFAVLVGLLYGNAVIGYGRFIGEGQLLLNMNQLRLLLNTILVPFLLLAALNQTRRFGVAIPGYLGLLVLLPLGIGMYQFLNRNMQAVDAGGTLRYVDGNGGIVIELLVTLAITAVFAFLIWRKAQWPWLYLAAIFMFLSTLLPLSSIGYLIFSTAEILLLLAFLLTEKALKDKNEPVPPGEQNEQQNRFD